MHKKEILFKGYHWKQEVLESTPKDGIFYLALNMTSKCNYRCPYCFVGLKNLKSSPDELTLSEKKRIIREAKASGAKELSMPGKGEPLADPDFWEILKEANQLGLWVVVYTNGFFLNEEKIKKLKEAQISLYIKVDTFDKSIYEVMVGKKNVFNTVRRNLDLLLKYFHEPEIIEGKTISRLGINSVVTIQSYKSIPEIYNWCKENTIYYTCRSPVKVGEELNQCGIYRFGITVENNGDIYVCPDAREGFKSIGSAKHFSLSDLINLRNLIYPLDSTSGYCFAKNHRNPEEIITQKQSDTFIEVPLFKNS